jgi:hypothetical protein
MHVKYGRITHNVRMHTHKNSILQFTQQFQDQRKILQINLIHIETAIRP